MLFVNRIIISGTKGFLGSKFDTSKFNSTKFFYAKNHIQLRRLVKKGKYDLLIHFGSENRDNSRTDNIIIKNIVNLRDIVESKSLKKILFISSDSVTKLYNKNKNLKITPYNLSKLFCEKYIMESYKKYKFEYVILRLNTVISFGSKKKNLFYYLENKKKFILNVPNQIDYNLMTLEQVYSIIFEIINNWKNYKNKVSKVTSNEILDSDKLIEILNKLKIKYRIVKIKSKNEVEKIIKLKNKNIIENLLYEIKKKKKKN